MSKVQELIRHKMAVDAIPDGGGLEAGLRFLSSKESIANGYRKAEEWVRKAITLVRSASDPNPYRESDDETIATHLVEQINKRKSNRCSTSPELRNS